MATASCAALLCVLAAAADAQTSSQEADAAPRQASRAALVEGYEAFFRNVDSDHDSRLSREEWGRSVDAAIGYGQGGSTLLANEDQLRRDYASVFEEADRDGDGRLTLDEVLAQPLQTFACADVDADGAISSTEQEQALDRCAHLVRRLG